MKKGRQDRIAETLTCKYRYYFRIIPNQESKIRDISFFSINCNLQHLNEKTRIP